MLIMGNKHKINVIIKVLGLLMATLLLSGGQNLNFFQDEYDVTMDISECTWFNTAYYRHCIANFVLYNRTQRVINASWENLKDIKRNVLQHVQVYKFVSNEYRFFPITATTNVCAEYLKNTLGIKDLLARTSNMDPCNFKKGHYHIRNAIPDFSKLPPHLPRGSYKMSSTFTYYSDHLFTIDYYGKIKDKPVDWKNIPKRNWY